MTKCKHLFASELLPYWLLMTLFSLLSHNVFAQSTAQTVDSQFFRGYLGSPNGSETCNPCVDDVIHAITTLHNHGETMGFNWGDDHPPVKGAGTPNHWQGIQRMPMSGFDVPYVIVSSSHRDRILRPDGEFQFISTPSRFAVIEMASRSNDGLRLRSNRLEFGRLTRDVAPNPLDRIVKSQKITSEFDHPGGMQAIGKYLLVGSDGNIGHSREVALFSLWDMSTPLSPRSVWDSPLWELAERNANSVGIVRLEEGRYLMLRALTDAKKLEFYILSNRIEENPAIYHDGVPWDLWDHQELQSELFNPDSSLDFSWADLGNILGEAGYQNTNIVTECSTGKLYLIASHGRRPQGFGGDDFVDAYRLDVPSERPNSDVPGEGVVITKVAKRHMFPSGNAGARQGDLQAAGGVYISPDNKLYFYATEHGATGEGGFVKMIEFGPEEPRSEVRFIDEAWIELYERTGYDGRSIILDYIDSDLRDYANFENIENFDNVASSIVHAIPSGYKLRLYANPRGSGGYLDLTGSGGVTRVPDLGSVVLSNGESADDQLSSAQWLGPLTAVNEETPEAFPASFELYQNYPNPFNPETVINYQINEEAEIRLEIYDIRGQLIKTLVEETKTPGFYSIEWDGRDNLGKEVASGTYLYRLEMGEFVKAKKLTLIR